MAGRREVRQLSDPSIFIDDFKVAIIGNSCEVELPGETSTRAVSAGNGAYSVVHGYNVEEHVGKVKFDLAATEQNLEFIQDYKARAQRTDLSTLKVVEADEVPLVFDHMVMTNKVTMPFEAEGNITVEFMGRYAGL